MFFSSSKDEHSLSQAEMIPSTNPSISLSSTLTISYINIRGQTGLNYCKQVQIESFIRTYKPDILHLQEINVTSDTFEKCEMINSNYNIISNNAVNKYGTASLVSSELETSNIKFDTDGRIIVFDVNNVTFGNVYFPCGSDQELRRKRENYAAETLPQLLVNAKDAGVVGGDWNCILEDKDATKNPGQKHSPCLKRLVKNFKWIDSFRELFPQANSYSRYYENDSFDLNWGLNLGEVNLENCSGILIFTV